MDSLICVIYYVPYIVLCYPIWWNRKGLILIILLIIEFLCWFNFSYQLKHGKGMMAFTCVLPIYAVGIDFAARLVWIAALETVRAPAGREKRQQQGMFVGSGLGYSRTDAASGRVPCRRVGDSWSGQEAQKCSQASKVMERKRFPQLCKVFCN